MTMYDPANPRHLAYRDHWKAWWTPEKEEALQQRFEAMGLPRNPPKDRS